MADIVTLEFPKNSQLSRIKITRYDVTEYKDHGAPCSIDIVATDAIKGSAAKRSSFWKLLSGLVSSINQYPDTVNYMQGDLGRPPRFSLGSLVSGRVLCGGEDCRIERIARGDELTIVCDKIARGLVYRNILSPEEYTGVLETLKNNGFNPKVMTASLGQPGSGGGGAGVSHPQTILSPL